MSYVSTAVRLLVTRGSCREARVVGVGNPAHALPALVARNCRSKGIESILGFTASVTAGSNLGRACGDRLGAGRLDVCGMS